jgi:MIP family channel proteins
MTMTAENATRSASDHASDSTRLHDHPLEQPILTVAVAEALGTFMLVLAITSTAVAASLFKPIAGVPYGSLAVPAAAGLALVLLVASLGQISGAHFNPAVTLGLAANRRFPWATVGAYVLAQFAGAIAAAATTWGLYGRLARTRAGLGATVPAAGVGVWRVLCAEAVGTFLLVLVVVLVGTDRRLSRGAAAAAIGASLAVAILVTGPISGGGINPARALGPMIVAGTFTDWWAYLVAPIVGGAVAVAVAVQLTGRTSPDA